MGVFLVFSDLGGLNEPLRLTEGFLFAYSGEHGYPTASSLQSNREQWVAFGFSSLLCISK